MQSFFNDLSNRDVIKVIASFLDFVSLGNFLKTSKVINHACKLSLPQRELSYDDIHKALDASLYSRYYYDIRVINASCFYRPIEVILYIDKFHTTMEEHFYVIGGKKQGHYKYHWDHGGIRQECFFKDNQIDGPCKLYYENGKLKEERFLKDGKMNGPWKWYYENGNIKEEGFYKDNQIDGPCKSYYENGNLKEEGFYKDGKRDGPYISYFTNGTVKIKNEFFL